MFYFIFSVLVIASVHRPILNDHREHLIKIATEDESLTADHQAITITESGREDLTPHSPTLLTDTGMISMKTTVIVILNVIAEELVNVNSCRLNDII